MRRHRVIGTSQTSPSSEQILRVASFIHRGHLAVHQYQVVRRMALDPRSTSSPSEAASASSLGLSKRPSATWRLVALSSRDEKPRSPLPRRRRHVRVFLLRKSAPRTGRAAEPRRKPSDPGLRRLLRFLRPSSDEFFQIAGTKAGASVFSCRRGIHLAELSKSAPCFSEGIPIPVSRTEKRSATSFCPSSSGSTEMETSPREVNLTALSARLFSTCRRRSGSPRSEAGTGIMERRSCRPFAPTARSQDGTISSKKQRAGPEIHGLQIKPPGLDLREVQNIVENAEKMLAAGTHGLGGAARRSDAYRATTHHSRECRSWASVSREMYSPEFALRSVRGLGRHRHPLRFHSGLFESFKKAAREHQDDGELQGYFQRENTGEKKRIDKTEAEQVVRLRREEEQQTHSGKMDRGVDAATSPVMRVTSRRPQRTRRSSLTRRSETRRRHEERTSRRCAPRRSGRIQ